MLAPDDIVYRRALKKRGYVKKAEVIILHPAALDPDPRDGVTSCQLARLTTPEAVLAGVPAGSGPWGIFGLRVSDIRELGLTVEFDGDASNPAHCSLRGTEDPDKRHALAKRAIPIHAP